MAMREGPLDTLDRARKVFLSSISDSIGKADAGADFYYAALSAERRGYILNDEDNSLIKMFFSVMKQEEGPLSSQTWDLEREAAQVDPTVFTSGVDEQQFISVLQNQSGQQLVDNPAYNEERVVPPQAGEGLAGRRVDIVDGKEDDPYRTHHYFAKFNPIAERMHHMVADFYTPSEAGIDSQSKIDADKELAWEKHMQEIPEKSFLLASSHYGKLDGEHATNHGLYEHDYLGWKSNNDNRINEIINRLHENGITDDKEIEHQLRKLHLEDKKKEWKDNLGFLDYMFGMEWLTPKQRNEAYQHMAKHGTSNSNQPLRFNTGQGINWIPRFKRNFHQRFAGMYNHWTRAPHQPGEPVKNKRIALPEKGEQIGTQDNLYTLRAHQPSGEQFNALERGLHFIDEMQKGDYERRLEQGDEDATYIASGGTKVPYIAENEDGVRTVQFHSPPDGEKKGLKYNALKLLLNIDGDGKLFETGKHEFYENWDKEKSPFTQDEIDEILQRRKVLAAQNSGAGRIARNESIMHFGGFVDPEHFPEYSNGSHETLSTYWQRPFFQGGMGKQPNELFNLIHNHSLLPDDLFEDISPKTTDELEAEEKEEEFDYDKDFETIMQERQTQSEPASVKEEEEEEEEEEYKPKRSLIFSRTGAGIYANHDFDKEGNVLDSKMQTIIAPFGQPTHEFTRMTKKQGDQYTHYTFADTGDISDMESNLNPHGVFHSARVAGASGKRNMARHMATADGKYANELYTEYVKSREKGDNKRADEMRDSLRGEKSGHLPVTHAFNHRGSVYDPTRSMHKNGHYYHNIGHMLGFASPNPVMSLQEFGRPDTHSTLANPDDLEDLKYVPAPVEKIKDRIRSVQKEIEETPESHVTTMGRLQAELESLERAKLLPSVSNPMLEPVQHEATRIGGMQSRWNPPGTVSLVGAPEEGGPLRTEIQERFDSLNDYRSILQSELDSKETNENRKNDLRSEIGEIENELNRLERQMPEKKQGIYFGAGHVPEMFRAKLSADSDAISKAGEHLKKMVGPEILNRLFSPDLPLDVLEGNIRMWAAMANDYLQKAPHESHGITTSANRAETQKTEMIGADTAYDVKQTVHNNPVKFNLQHLQALNEGEQGKQMIAESLGLDINKPHVQSTIDNLFGAESEITNDLLSRINQVIAEGGDLKQVGIPMMTVGQYMKASGMVDEDMNFDNEIALLKTKSPNRNAELTRLVSNLSNQIRPDAGIAKRGMGELNEKLGFKFHSSYSPDKRIFDKRGRDIRNEIEERVTDLKNEIEQTKLNNKSTSKLETQLETLENELKPTTKITRRAKGKRQGNLKEAFNTQQVLDSILISNPDIEPEKHTGVETVNPSLYETPVGKFGPDTHTVQSLYNSGGYKHEFGGIYEPTFDYHIDSNGQVEITIIPKGKKQHLVQPMENIYRLFPDLIDTNGSGFASPNYVHHDGKRRSDITGERRRIAPQFLVDEFGQAPNTDKVSVVKSEIGLADLTNPDIIRKELGKEVPLLQPMHRIFELDDLEHLRGFTGDWIVSVMPEGERGFVKKEDDEVSAKPFTLSKEDKENFKKVSSENFHIDVIKLEDGYYIFDVIEFDDNEVHDTVLDDRIKILRGGMEGVENIHVPSASDTRLTDDAGLELIVEDLQKEHDKLLLRDAKSVYMVGELRHPKWVMLNPGKDVVLRVLERRGNGPYTYRLGTGPITQEDSLGDRAVESGGETYMDVGAAFDSSEKFNEGDHVRVNVANVGEMETIEGQKIYTVSGSDIKEEAEGEGLVSQETLGILAKSDSDQWLCEVTRATSGLRITMPQGDVVYKCTQSGRLWTVHSPLASSSYLIRLSESQRQYWSPVAGALLKADLEIKEEVHETEEEGEPLIKPKKIKDTNWWDEEKKKVLVKGLLLVEKLLKSGAGAVGQSSTGTMGLGIGYATPIESPTGPTNLHDEKTMPDFDNRKRPGEDSTIEPETEEEEPSKHIVIPTEEGVLEVTDDSAVFHT
tara:strand:+ start:6359 stop:12301 length:5943 start_codon:yes stop_codon:yes gene_type:complete